MALKPVATVNDVLCDACSESTRVEGYGTQFGVLRANWGYGSRNDGERYEVHLCERCFFRTLSGLRRERMVSDLFNDQAEDLSSFGRVAHDDFLTMTTNHVESPLLNRLSTSSLSASITVLHPKCDTTVVTRRELRHSPSVTSPNATRRAYERARMRHSGRIAKRQCDTH